MNSLFERSKRKSRTTGPAHHHLAPKLVNNNVVLKVLYLIEGRTFHPVRHQFGGGLAYRDAVQTTLNVGYPVPVLREVRLTQTHDKEVNLLGGVSPQLLEGTGTVQVSLTNSRAIELRESLDRVLHYPYGCVEQTTSSTLP